MDKAIQADGKTVNASLIVRKYEDEQQIRKQSRENQLRCIECKTLVRYKHGEKEAPFFSHVSKRECDYSQYCKKEGEERKLLREKVEKTLIAKLGEFEIDSPKKILKKEYADLCVLRNGQVLLCVDFCKKDERQKRLEDISAQYDKMGVHHQWIIIDDDLSVVKDVEAPTAKRFCINDKGHPNVLMITKNGEELCEFIDDPKKDREQPIAKSFEIEMISFEKGFLTMQGFSSFYEGELRAREEAFHARNERCQNYANKPEKTSLTENLHSPSLLNVFPANQCYFNDPLVQRQGKGEARTSKIYQCIQCGMKYPGTEMKLARQETGICKACYEGMDESEKKEAIMKQNDMIHQKADRKKIKENTHEETR